MHSRKLNSRILHVAVGRTPRFCLFVYSIVYVCMQFSERWSGLNGQSISPDVLVTFGPHKLVKLIQGSKVTLRKQRRPSGSLQQLLSHAFIPESVKEELQLQNPFQPFLFHLFTLELLTTCRFLNGLLDLSKAMDCWRHSHQFI